mmetsp:Transcript_18354/g.50418  ORF Transcript_18354/g.50418 Transcript_18354/m.50418 type:complete len:223 (-) Transcript_18354:27-695(-)
MYPDVSAMPYVRHPSFAFTFSASPSQSHCSTAEPVHADVLTVPFSAWYCKQISALPSPRSSKYGVGGAGPCVGIGVGSGVGAGVGIGVGCGVGAGVGSGVGGGVGIGAEVSHSFQPSDADGHGKVFQPESSVCGQHWSPLQEALLPGQAVRVRFDNASKPTSSSLSSAPRTHLPPPPLPSQSVAAASANCERTIAADAASNIIFGGAGGPPMAAKRIRSGTL